MPQLDITTYFSQIFWLILSFVLLFILLSKIFLPKLASILELRADKIAKNLEAAHIAKNEAVILKQQYELLLKESALKREAEISEARLEITKMFDQHLKEQEKEQDMLLKQAQEKIDGFVKNSAKEIEEISTLASKELLAKLGLENISDEGITSIIMEKLKKEK
jgi:F-type H+-transporting ATPase subunit b